MAIEGGEEKAPSPGSVAVQLLGAALVSSEQ